MAPFSNKVSTFKIYLSGLPDGLKSTDIRVLFEPYGRIVECEVFKKNYGFVHMEEAECGRKAVAALNKKDIQGKMISVCESKNLEGPNIATTRLSVKNLPFGVTPQRVRAMFQKYGLILECETGQRGDAIVSLEATGDIRTAINEMNGFILDDRTLIVEPVKVNLKADKPMGFGAPSYDSPSKGGPSNWNANPRQPFQPRGAGRGGHMPRGRGGGHGAGSFPPYGGGYGPAAVEEEFYAEESYGDTDGGYYEEEEEEYYPEYVPPPPPRGRGGLAGMRGFGGPRPPFNSVPRNSGSAGPRFGLGDRNHYFGNGSGGFRGAPGRGRGGPGPRLLNAGGYGGGYEDSYYEEEEDSYYQGPSQFGNRFQDSRSPPKKKIAKGEPYPPPPAPHPSLLGLGMTRRGRGRGGPRGAGLAGGSLLGGRQRGERGGVNKLTTGKLALAEALKAQGVRLPTNSKAIAQALTLAGYAPPGPQGRPPPPPPPPKVNPNLPGESSGGGSSRGSYGAVGLGRTGGEADPFAPSAAEKRLLSQQQQYQSGGGSIDFAADIILS